MKTHRILTALFASVCLAALARADATLTHRYDFNGNLDDSVGSINATGSSTGTYSTAPVFSADTPSGAVGSGQSLQLGQTAGTRSGFSINSAALSSTGSISLWFQHDLAAIANDGQVDYVFNIGTGTWNHGLKLHLNNNSSNLALRVGGADAQVVVGTHMGVAQDAWYHVAVTWDSSASGSSASYYINGSLVASQSIAGSIAGIGSAALSVGNWSFPAADSASFLANQFQGSVYDLQIYAGQLDAAQVALLAGAPGSAIPEPSSATALFGVCALGLGFLRRRR